MFASSVYLSSPFLDFLQNVSCLLGLHKNIADGYSNQKLVGDLLDLEKLVFKPLM